MFLEKQLGNGCAWINLDLDKLNTWIITVKMGL